MDDNATRERALCEILAKPTVIKTYPPPPGGIWQAVIRRAVWPLNEKPRPYEYIGKGSTEQAAIDDLNAKEAADTWSAESDKPTD